MPIKPMPPAQKNRRKTKTHRGLKRQPTGGRHIGSFVTMDNAMDVTALKGFLFLFKNLSVFINLCV